MDRLEDAALPVFARHETFHPRYGWFRKGVVAASGRSDVFTRDDATVELGVGKNMVRAIRFWGKAAKILADAPNPDRPRLPLVVPSLNGAAIFDDEAGLDPYLELPGSLWLLHWWMLAPPCHLPVWWLTFNRFGAVEFSEDELVTYIVDELERSPTWAQPVAASVAKDVDCLLRMYTPHATRRLALDDLLDCPFRELGLIEPVWDEKRRYRFVLGPKPTLPPQLVVYACLDYLAMSDRRSRVGRFSRLANDPCSPGRVFKLTEDALVDAIETFAVDHRAVQITSVAGAPQLAFDDDPKMLAIDALTSYYRSFGRESTVDVALGDAPTGQPPSLFDATGPSGAATDPPNVARSAGGGPRVRVINDPAESATAKSRLRVPIGDRS